MARNVLCSTNVACFHLSLSLLGISVGISTNGLEVPALLGLVLRLLPRRQLRRRLRVVRLGTIDELLDEAQTVEQVFRELQNAGNHGICAKFRTFFQQGRKISILACMAQSKLELIDIDICGPIQKENCNGVERTFPRPFPSPFPPCCLLFLLPSFLGTCANR